ncbi:MAG: IS5 family transposase [Sinobacteraceae bacterium]|nr:IS5 family transposase [Nevskiaceae bacterium]
MTRASLDDAQWASLMLTIQRIPRAWKRDEAGLRRFCEAVLWVLRTGAPWRDLPESLGHWASVYHRWRRWCLRGWSELIFEHLRPSVPADGVMLADSTTCKAHRAAAGAAHSTAEAEALGKSRGGLGSKIHACTDGLGRILRLACSPAQHSDLRYARALIAALPATDAALDRGYVSAKLHADLARQGCTVHTPPQKDMRNPPPWDKAIYARRHRIETMFSRFKDCARVALRRDKTRRSWMGFVHLAATRINLRLAEFSHTA